MVIFLHITRKHFKGFNNVLHMIFKIFEKMIIFPLALPEIEYLFIVLVGINLLKRFSLHFRLTV